jgi:hypothetical protein
MRHAASPLTPRRHLSASRTTATANRPKLDAPPRRPDVRSRKPLLVEEKLSPQSTATSTSETLGESLTRVLRGMEAVA